MNIRKGGWLLLATLFAAAFGVSAAVAKRRLSRFEVSGTSMSPAYNHGDWLLVDLHAFRQRAPQPGEVVILRDPREAGRQIIKRVLAVTPNGGFDVRGDNPAESTDSRTFGPVSLALLVGKVRWRFRSTNPTPRHSVATGKGVGG